MNEQITIKADVNLTDSISSIGSTLIMDAGFWMPISLIVSIILVQFAKSVLKHYVPRKYINWRKAATFLVAYIIGFQVGMYYLEGDNVTKWATFIGFVNPFFYLMLKSLAVKRDWFVLQSMLKMRPLVKNEDGSVDFDQTTTFMTPK